MSAISTAIRRLVGADVHAGGGPVQAIWNGKVIASSDRTVVIDGDRNAAAAWCYGDPCRAAENIRDHVAFWHGVKVRRVAQVVDPHVDRAA